MTINFVFALLTIIVSMLLNSRGLGDGPSPTFKNLIFTIVFLVLWFLFGVFRGRERKMSYMIFAIIFWAVALGTSFFAMNLGPNPLVMVNFAIMAPVNGLMFFEFMRSKLFFAAMFLPLIITCIGYLLGLKKSAKNNMIKY
ncbi:hypothetical protein [Desulfosporosinus nitroreducens]|uniref:hypothetical protein n=1 Tax=Desulfosporosinus nitroreducens TaxID=2018668 RepID=UPI00207D1D50|nr:hypothetical protein [Desulfosporosinus nitroreducens]MCO1604543.1 hypothetical protein [Desulfosporosinus nitroreducens]